MTEFSWGVTDTTLKVKWNWIKCSDRMPDCKKCLAVCMSEKDAIYNLRAEGWVMDTIYSCWIKDGKFIIESHGPELPATHWMSLPKLPEDI